MDAFFIGDGSVQLLERGGMLSLPTYADQLTSGVGVDTLFSIEDDRGEFFGEELDVTVENIKDVWSESKVRVYGLFDYLAVKSRKYAGVPIRVEDLVFEDDDLYFTEVLIDRGLVDLYRVSALAKLVALREMGFHEFRFYAMHNCPLCHAAHKRHFKVEDVLGLLMDEVFLHGYCDFELIPILRREKYDGLVTELNIDLKVGDILIECAPKEYVRELESFCESYDFYGILGVNCIKFVNMPSFCKQEDIPNHGGTVALLIGNQLVVHNSYVEEMGPMEYIMNFIEYEKESEKVDVSDLVGDTYFIDGREVVKYQNCFWDTKTGSRVK